MSHIYNQLTKGGFLLKLNIIRPGTHLKKLSCFVYVVKILKTRGEEQKGYMLETYAKMQ